MKTPEAAVLRACLDYCFFFLGLPPFETFLILFTTDLSYRAVFPALVFGSILAVLSLKYAASGVIPRMSPISRVVNPSIFIISAILLFFLKKINRLSYEVIDKPNRLLYDVFMERKPCTV